MHETSPTPFLKNEEFINGIKALFARHGLEYIEEGKNSYVRKKDDPTKKIWFGTTSLLGAGRPTTVEEFEKSEEWQELLNL